MFTQTMLPIFVEKQKGFSFVSFVLLRGASWENWRQKKGNGCNGNGFLWKFKDLLRIEWHLQKLALQFSSHWLQWKQLYIQERSIKSIICWSM